MEDLGEFEKIVLRDFVAENWSAFTSFCETHGEEVANDIYAALGGEPE